MKILIISIIFLINCVHSLPTYPNERIGNGHEAEQHQFPWQVSLLIHLKTNKTMECSGTLISSEWVLTAAQCLQNVTNITLGFGSNEWNKPKFSITTNLTFSHPNYKNSTLANDIGLIKLNESINITTDSVKPILIPGGDQTGLSFEGVKGLSAGWGELLHPEDHCINSNENVHNDDNNNNNETSNETCLNYTEMTVISNYECGTIYGSTITDSRLCARWLSGGNLCDRDFGGSLVILEPEGWKIIGVASNSQGCNSPKPAIYSRITSYMAWISNTTGIAIEFY